jgi:ribosomal protein S2
MSGTCFANVTRKKQPEAAHIEQQFVNGSRWLPGTRQNVLTLSNTPL